MLKSILRQPNTGIIFIDGTPGTPHRTPGTPRAPGDLLPGTSPARALASSPMGKKEILLV